MSTVVAQVDAHEGPVYVAEEDALYFTSVPRPQVDIKRLSLHSGEVSVLRADANKANGMTLAPDGRLLVCEQGTRSAPARISLVDRATGASETLVDGWRGAPLNSPNDGVVKRDGTAWFTDPSYGFLQGFRPDRSSATSSTAMTRRQVTPTLSPTASTSPTALPSRPTNASCTSATRARAGTGSRRSTWSTGTP
jgi:sugar lactone lactonase YvrE